MGRHEGGVVSRRTWRIITGVGVVLIVVLAGIGLIALIPADDQPQAISGSSPVTMPTSEVQHEHNIAASEAVPAGQMAQNASDRVTLARQAVANDSNARAEQARLDQVGPVLFAPDTAMLDPQNAAMVNQITNLMREDPDLRVMVVGNTAVEIAEQPLCLQLSQLRAEQVATQIEMAGIPADRVSAVGISHTQPLDTAWQSRRAEFVVQLH